MILLSHSGIETYASCPRKYHYVYNEKRVPIQQVDALAFGTVVHAALAKLFLGEPLDLRAYASKVKPEDAYKIAAMILNYPETWKQYRVIGVEVPFESRIINPRTGKILRGAKCRGFVDAVLEKDGKTYVLEHKTTSDEIIGFGAYWQRLGIDDQHATYKRVLKADGVIYSVLKKPKIRPAAIDKKNAGGESATEQQVLSAYGDRCSEVIRLAPEEYYQWREIHRTPEEDAEAEQGFYDRTKAIMDAHRGKRFPRHPGSCRAYGRVCPFLEVCSGSARIGDDALFCNRVTDR